MTHAMFDTLAVARDLHQTHGTAAAEIADRTAREHLRKAAWTAGAQWLRVAAHLREQTGTPGSTS